jgi:formylmethanofuran dehydrogenase subunit E
MALSAISEEKIREVVRFHGHSCPGLAIGIRAAELALSEFERDEDEEITAVVETDMCGVDAIQFLTGCTFGKGNLVHLDYGKNAFSFYRRSDGRGIRIVVRPDALGGPDEEIHQLRGKMAAGEELSQEESTCLKRAVSKRTQSIMTANLHDLFNMESARRPIPRKARILESLTCENCGETMMESRSRRMLGKTLCLPCFEMQDRKF